MSIYLSYLTSIPHENSFYMRRYVKFIESCILKNTELSSEIYTENHHILPKSLFPDYMNLNLYSWNKVTLTARQHYIAHLLLWKSFRNVATTAAIRMMSGNFIKNSKMYEIIKCEFRNTVVVTDRNKNSFRVVKNDPRLLSKELTYPTKGRVSVKDKNGNTLSVLLDDPRFISKELVTLSKGKLSVKDKDGNTFQVSVDDPRLKSGEIAIHTKGKAVMKDKDGNIIQVSVDDPRLKSGELVGIHKGTVTVRDKEGNKLRVSKDDPRIKTGVLVGTTKGKTRMKDKDGNFLFVFKDDPRIKSGELVGINKNLISITDGIKNKMIPKDSLIPEGYCKGQTRITNSPVR